MEAILLLLYSLLVWLVFFKFRLLPWNIVSQVIVFTIPIVGLALTILLLNIWAPSSPDVRVISYVVQIVPRVAGRVTEVPVEPDRPVRKGDILFKIDPTLYSLEARALQGRIPEIQAKLAAAEAYQRELLDQLKSSSGRKDAIAARLALARRRVDQTRELADAGAGPRFDHEQAEAELKNLEAELAAATAGESQMNQKLSARVDGGDLAEVAQTKAMLAQVEAELAQAQWKMDEATVRAPCDGTVVNLQLRPGSTVAAFPSLPAMSFVENEQWILALFAQNELREVRPGNDAEITLKTHPGLIIKCRVDSIIWASGTGQLPISGVIPQQLTQPVPPGRFAVRLRLADGQQKVFLATGAAGNGAIYTDSGEILHVIRKVMLRVSAKLNWLVLKLH